MNEKGEKSNVEISGFTQLRQLFVDPKYRAEWRRQRFDGFQEHKVRFAWGK